MKLRVLGCSGGVGQGLYTSSYLIDNDILLDAGSGVGNLSLDEMHQLTHIFVTHSHMDHILSIPLLADTLYQTSQTQSLCVYARPETLDAIKKHIFNWQIWPDFTQLPSVESPVLKLIAMNQGDIIEVGDRQIEMVNVNHAVPASAFIVTSYQKVFAYSGDTTTTDDFWQRLNQAPSLDFLVVESAFAEEDIALAKLSKHFCPSLLAQDLEKLIHKPRIGLAHFKPGKEQYIFEQCCEQVKSRHKLCHLACGDIFQI
ncbi:CAMP phosphodiesterases class-II:Metallo-beta-lactamase superfamily [hydrothermal vent metagenome]|uniref:cAMP phosphodiesterases class-II:Metallo-beta-lactamase superfamily n=1 Tax=hydrothermal vent metagenome TaxID=652676 RepID=A0A3B0WSD9_9ZZZZ